MKAELLLHFARHSGGGMQQRSRRDQSRHESATVNIAAPGFQSQADSVRQDSDLIARRAYQRYEERGREDGHDLEDWLSAEQDLRGSASDGNTPRDRNDVE
jgi:hypothetical protein